MAVSARAGAVGALRLVCTAIAGLGLAWAFPPHNSYWLAVPSIAVFTLCVWRRGAWGAALIAAVYGAAFFLPLISWMRVVGDDAWVMLSLICVFWVVLTGVMVALVTRLPLWPLWAACCWNVGEYLRDHIPWGGFAWGRLAFSQADSPLVFLSTVGGAPLVTFSVALLGALVAAAALRLWPALGGSPRWGSLPHRSARRAAGALVLAASVVLAALATSGVSVLPQPGSESSVTAAVVQGNVPRAGLGFLGNPRDVLDNHIRATKQLAADVAAGVVPAPELVVWPENTSDFDPYANPAIAADIQSAVDTIGAAVLVGAVMTNPADSTTVLNVGIVWNPGSGPAQRYAKRHPVPFGEYIPFRDVLSKLIDRFALIPRDFAAGDTPGVLTLGPATVGDVICFEVADDQVVRDAITGGGRLLVVQTNNATYGYTGQPEQQLAITRLRSVEHGRTALVAATSGVSAIISTRGQVTDLLPEFVAGSLVTSVTQTDSLTMSDRLGERPELTLVALGLLAALFALVRRRLGSSSTGRPAGRGTSPTAQEIDVR